MGFTQPSVTLRTLYLDPALEVLDCHRVVIKVYVINSNPKGFGYATPKMKQKVDKQPVTKVA